MVKAIFIPAHYKNIQDIVNCLKTCELLTPLTKLIQTPTNASICSDMGNFHQFKIQSKPDFSCSEMLHKEVLRGKDSIFIESKKSLKELFQLLGLDLEYANFDTALCIIKSKENESSECKATFLYLPDFPKGISNIDSEANDDTSETLQIVDQELLDFLLRDSQATVKTFENIITDSVLSLLTVKEVQHKLKKIESTIDDNLARNEPKNTDILKTIRNVKNLGEKIEILTEKVQSISQLVNLDEPDFTQVKAPFIGYQEGTIEWSHRRSEDNSSHVFLLKNLTEMNLNKVNIYNSDDEEKMECIDIKPYEEVEVKCDLLIDQLKLLGKIEFDIFYCCFKLAKSLSAFCIEIISIEKVQNENNKFNLSYQCSVTAIKGLQLMHNDVVLIKSINTKNFQNGALTFSIRDFKGEVSIYFIKDNKEASNRFSLTV